MYAVTVAIAIIATAMTAMPAGEAKMGVGCCPTFPYPMGVYW